MRPGSGREGSESGNDRTGTGNMRLVHLQRLTDTCTFYSCGLQAQAHYAERETKRQQVQDEKGEVRAGCSVGQPEFNRGKTCECSEASYQDN